MKSFSQRVHRTAEKSPKLFAGVVFEMKIKNGKSERERDANEEVLIEWKT